MDHPEDTESGEAGVGPRRRSVIPAWGVLVFVVVVLAGGVFWFLGRLPEPPRYDELRVEPGSTARPIRAIRLSLDLGGESWSAPVEDVGFDRLGDIVPEGGACSTGRYRIPVLPKEAGPAIFGIESIDLAVRILQDDRVLLEAGGEGTHRSETEPVLIPTRASDIVLEFDVIGSSPRLVAWWRVPEGTPQSFARLAKPSRDGIENAAVTNTPAP